MKIIVCPISIRCYKRTIHKLPMDSENPSQSCLTCNTHITSIFKFKLRNDNLCGTCVARQADRLLQQVRSILSHECVAHGLADRALLEIDELCKEYHRLFINIHQVDGINK